MIGILLLSHISSFFCSFFRRSTARGEYVWRSLANGTLKDNLFVFFFLFFVLFWVCLFSLIPFVRVLRLTGSSLFNYRLLVVFLILFSLVWSLFFCFLLDLSSVFYALLLHLSLLFFSIFIVVFIILLSLVFGLLFDLLLYLLLVSSHLTASSIFTYSSSNRNIYQHIITSIPPSSYLSSYCLLLQLSCSISHYIYHPLPLSSLSFEQLRFRPPLLCLRLTFDLWRRDLTVSQAWCSVTLVAVTLTVTCLQR